MDIVIKSFNRPYYLERCLRSIYQFVSGDFQIIILEDGTPPKYLDRIKNIFPDVRIVYSPFYETKVKALHDHVHFRLPYKESVIPIAFWVDEIAKCSDYFLLLEDDIWLTTHLSIDELEHTMVTENIVMTKLSWHGNAVLVSGKMRDISTNLEEIVPRIPVFASGIFMNKYRIRSLLYHSRILKLIKSEFQYQMPYYTIYSVASACFSKEYWLQLWDKDQSNIQEHLQLQKAAKWYEAKKGRYAKTKVEVTATSFLTSATNMFEGVALDVFYFNYYLNEAWLAEQFDAMENFPFDFSETCIKIILDHANDSHCSYSEWVKWTEHFKGHFRSIGCKVD